MPTFVFTLLMLLPRLVEAEKGSRLAVRPGGTWRGRSACMKQVDVKSMEAIRRLAMASSPDDVIAEIRAVLAPGERLLLVGEEKSSFNGSYATAALALACMLPFECFFLSFFNFNAWPFAAPLTGFLCTVILVTGFFDAKSKGWCYAVTDRRLLQVAQDGAEDIATREQIEKISAERDIVSLKLEGLKNPIRLQPIPGAPRLIGTWN